MKRNYDLELNLPDGIERLEILDIEQIFYNALSAKLEELQVPKEVMDDWNQFDVTLKIK